MQPITNIQVTEPDDVAEPFTLDEVKEWLRVDFSDDDQLITRIAKAARQAVEGMTSINIVAKQIVLDVETNCEGTIHLPYATNVINLIVASLNDSDEETELTTGFYLRGNALRLASGGRYSVSYTTTPALTENLLEAVKMEVAERYQNGGENNGVLSSAAKEKVQPYVMPWL